MSVIGPFREISQKVLIFEVPCAGRFFGVGAVPPRPPTRACLAGSASPSCSEPSSADSIRALDGIILTCLILYRPRVGSQAWKAVLAAGYRESETLDLGILPN